MAARVTLLVALVVATLTGAVLVHQSDPGGNTFPGPCRFLEATGLYCPGCGGTRGMRALLHLRFGEALAYNPFVFVAVGLFLVLSLTITKELLGDYYRGPTIRFPAWLGWTLGALLIIFGIVRNIPAWPFTLLTP